MAVNICETLLHDPKDCEFHLIRQPLEVRRDFQLYVDLTALGEAADIPAERVFETCFVQQGRMQQV